ncbi:MAG: hypothetical protein NVSMB6_02430 [Burkholderiaceae bacterium]
MSMENMLLRTYASFDNAQQARSALIAAGFSADAVCFTARQDEAGPVTGNFVIDREQDSNSDRRTPNLAQGFDPNETQSTAPVDWGSSYILTIDAQDNDQLRLAAEITKQFGGVDINELVPPCAIST